MASVRVAPAGRQLRRAAHVRGYTEIAGILVRHGFVEALHLRRYVAAGRGILSAFGRAVQPDVSRAVRLRLAFKALGPTFIKFGQAFVVPAGAGPQLHGYPLLGLAGFLAAGLGLAAGILRSGCL